MAIDTTSPRTRRAILGAAAGAIAATAVGAAMRPLPADAVTQGVNYQNDENGNDVIQGFSLEQVGFPDSGKGTGIHGVSVTGEGVVGHASGSGIGVHGDSASGSGVEGSSQSGAGVYAHSGTGLALRAETTDTDAIHATSDSKVGVLGQSSSGFGVKGIATAKTSDVTVGVYGQSASTNGTGVSGYANATSGFTAGTAGATESPAGAGASGWARAGGTGVMGISTKIPSLGPISPSTGVYGVSTIAGGTGVVGQAAVGRGGLFSGGKAQIRLAPSAAATHPASGARGDLFVDNSGRLWFCRGGTTWVKLA